MGWQGRSWGPSHLGVSPHGGAVLVQKQKRTLQLELCPAEPWVPPAVVAEGAWLFASGFPTGRSPAGCPAAAHSLTLLLDPTAGKIWSGKTLPPAQWEPARARCVPGSRFKPTDSCRVRTVTLLCRNASRCFIGTLDFGVAVLNWFILLNYQVTTYYYTQNTKAENIYAPHNPLKYSLKLKCQ